MRTRFAPSPTGPLHLGHAFSAMIAHDMARTAAGAFHLRIEDIDPGRCKPEWVAEIEYDLSWLGLAWESPVLFQSQRLEIYRNDLKDLWDQGLLYPCFCNRRDILEAANAPQEGAAQHGPDGIVYPGTCRPDVPPTGPMPQDVALRLDVRRAIAAVDPAPLAFYETGRTNQKITLDPSEMIEKIGDIALSRRDFGTSYHLSVVRDDADQQITHVTRGEDLFDATAIHVLLQRLMKLPSPTYHHHRLIRDEHGKRLAKRDDARAIARYREDGWTPDGLRAHLDLTAPSVP